MLAFKFIYVFVGQHAGWECGGKQIGHGVILPQLVFWLGDEDMLIVPAVVVVVELHDAAHKRVVRVLGLLVVPVVQGLQWNHDRLLQKVGGAYHCVHMQLLEVLELLDPFNINLNLLISFKVRISGTVLDLMAFVFAANAPHIPIVHLDLRHVVLAFLLRFVFLLLLILMLAELTAWLVLAPLAAAPPNFTAKLRHMHPTRPVKILLLQKLLATQFTDLRLRIKVTLLLNQPQYFNPHFGLFLNQSFHLLVMLSSDYIISL